LGLAGLFQDFKAIMQTNQNILTFSHARSAAALPYACKRGVQAILLYLDQEASTQAVAVEAQN
jgi:hypothetical protein